MKPNNASTDTTKTVAIFMEAARRVSEHAKYGTAKYSSDGKKHLPSCIAIRDCGGSDECVSWYQDVMLDGEVDVSVLWGSGTEYSRESYKGRVLLLCFAAAMVEAGDAP